MNRIQQNIGLIILLLILLAAALAAPHLASNMVHTLILIFFYAYVSTAWDILGGYTGQMSFGFSLFLGVGAYTSTMLFLKLGLSPWLGMLASGLAAALLGAFMGYLCFRSQIVGFYFALITIVFVEIARYITLSIEALGAAKGLYIPYVRGDAVNFQFDAKFVYLYVIMILYLLIIFVYRLIMRTKPGSYFLSIRENQDAAEAIGVNTFKYKMIAVVISSFFGGVGGTFWAQYIAFIDPYTMFKFMLSVEIIFFAVAGGRGKLFGALVGAALFVPLSEFLRTSLGQGTAGVHVLTYGIILILVMRFMPDGIMDWVSHQLRKLRGVKP